MHTPPPLMPYLKDGLPRPPRHGHCGALHLKFELEASQQRSILRYLERHAPLIVQQALYFDAHMPDMPCVYILSSGGPCIEGDRFFQRFEVEKNASAQILTGAASKVAEMSEDYCDMRQEIRLEAGAYLEYLPEPIIPCRHSRYHSETKIVAPPTATLIYAEIYTDGRHYYGSGEHFDYDILSISNSVYLPDETLRFRDQWVVEPQFLHLSDCGIMADYSIIGSVLVVTPPDIAQYIFEATEVGDHPTLGYAIGISKLPNDTGVLYKVLTHDTETAQHLTREFCSSVREKVKGVTLPKEFPWRSFNNHSTHTRL